MFSFFSVFVYIILKYIHNNHIDKGNNNNSNNNNGNRSVDLAILVFGF